MPWFNFGGNVDFQAGTAAEAEMIRKRVIANPNDPAVAGMTRVRNAPAGGQPSGSPAAAPPQDLIGRIKSAITAEPQPGQPSFAGIPLRGEGMLASGVRSLGRAVLPGSYPAAAVDVATMGLGGKLKAAGEGLRQIPKVGRVLAPVAGLGAEVGVPAAVGAATAKVTGEDVKAGALTGATAGGINAVFGGAGSVIGGFLSKYAHLNVGAFKSKVREILGPKYAQAIVGDIPSLGKSVKSLEDVQLLQTEAGGRKVLGDLFDKTEAQIAKAVGKAEVQVPQETVALAQSLRGPAAAMAQPQPAMATGAAGGTAQIATMTVDKAIELGKVLRAKGAAKTPDARVYRQAADGLLEQVNGLLATAGQKDLAAAYQGLRQDYSKFMRVKDYLDSGGVDLFPPMTRGGSTLDLVRGHRALMDSVESLPPQEFPNLHTFYKGSEPLGTGPTGFTFHAPRIYTGSKARIGETLPPMPFVALPKGMQSTLREGLPTPRGTAARVSAIGAVPTIESMVQQSLGSERQGP